MPVVSRPRTRSEGVDGARHPGRAVRAAVINASPAGIEAANAASRRVPVRSAPAETEQFSVAASMVSGSPLIAGRHRPRLRRDPAPASQEPRGHSLTELIMRLVPPSRSRRSRSTPTPSGASETGRAGGPVHATRIARAGAGRHWAAGVAARHRPAADTVVARAEAATWLTHLRRGSLLYPGVRGCLPAPGRAVRSRRPPPPPPWRGTGPGPAGS
jgi:hypothetical protein